MGIVASFFQMKTDPNQAIKQACVHKQLYKTFGTLGNLTYNKTCWQKLSVNSAFLIFLHLTDFLN